jgi:pilus assembly protein TadC
VHLLNVEWKLAVESASLRPGAQAIFLLLLALSPLFILGADFLLDDLLVTRSDKGEERKFRALLYGFVFLISAAIIYLSESSSGYFGTFLLTAENIFIVAALIATFYGAMKWQLQRNLNQKRKARIEQINLELPQYLEMFHILISSGMSVLTALKSLTQTSAKSEIDLIIREILREVEQGRSIERAIDKAVLPVGSHQLRRFSDAVILGMDRGSSMGQSIKNLVSESRNYSKVLVMERAGKAEIKLLIPVVFLILPISVLFAIWPSYVNLISIMG